MQRGRRNAVKTFLAGSLLPAVYTGPLLAAAYPERPVRVIAPYAPGGTTDFITRLIAQNLQEELGQSFVVENKPGAGGNIGSNFVVNARPDGYTLLAGSLSTFALNAAVYQNLGHDPLTDLVPVAVTTVVPLVLVASPKLKVKDLKGLVALLKSHPGLYNYGSSGSGTSSHIAFELFLEQTGTQVVHVPYKGVSQALVDLLAGNISLLFASPSVVLEYLKDGRLVALAAISPNRLKALPNVPTAAEAGFPDFDAYSWNCLFAPKGTPAAATDTLFAAVQRILGKPAVIKQLEEQGMLPMLAKNREETVRYTRAEFARWVPFVKKMNIRLD
ncbi:Tripartite tricarboxylate transporter family receptor [Pigmentiphaga humi]|uniref:Tripartite tricarboxylate transporter family receptor n=1 Tax=Pigmentiphaga humi TaxID=2478468 RepID=A0A3P4B5X7_9BURK|nr:tripartite tricarboxylate transporter substrate-binding protein [Pigmentiphaga humi]VCU71677.1 Tripartite tricarboxylate transporter family receptor [Pigmentiphaga humi]